MYIKYQGTRWFELTCCSYYCCDVKYASNWQDAFHLCEDKYIEFKWIKGHSGNEEQDFCHQLAKVSTR